jgi:glycosyltransferase involved in cell wall biosynthesis
MVTYQWDYARQTSMNEGRTLKGLLAPLLERLALRPADLVLVTAPWLQEEVWRRYRKETVLLPNWVDLEGIAASWGDVSREEGLVLFAGRLHASKGIDVLLEAFARVARSRPQARLVVCGEGEERENLERRRRALGLERAAFAGRVSQEDALGWMRRAAVFVLPTLTMEGHPKGLIEAMACGAACVASDVPGNRESIRHGIDGLLIPPADPYALAEAVEGLLGDADQRARLGAEAARGARRFAFSEIVPREIAVLRSLSAGESP